jgi:hypothetical protein
MVSISGEAGAVDFAAPASAAGGAANIFGGKTRQSAKKKSGIL